MKTLNRQVGREWMKVVMMIIFLGISSFESLAQKANVMMFLPENTSEFVDIKKFGVKEQFDHPNTYSNKESNPNSIEAEVSSVKYEFVIFKSESETVNDPKVIEGGLIFLDKQKFRNMNLSLLKGDPYAVFSSEFNILISDRIARAYFGEEDPLNKILILDGKYAVMIKGVYRTKENSLPMEFDFIAGPLTNDKINLK